MINKECKEYPEYGVEKLLKLLSAFDIRVKDQNGCYKSAYCILLEFANKLNQQAEETADGN